MKDKLKRWGPALIGAGLMALAFSATDLWKDHQLVHAVRTAYQGQNDELVRDLVFLHSARQVAEAAAEPTAVDPPVEGGGG